METYRLSDLVMVSSEVNLEMLQSFNADYSILLAIIQVVAFSILLGLFWEKARFKERLVKSLFGIVAFLWLLISVIYYPSYIAPVAWYWRWIASVCFLQSIFLTIALLRIDEVRVNKVILLFGVLILFVPIEGLFILGSPIKVLSFFCISPLKLSLFSLWISIYWVDSTLRKFLLSVSSVLIIFHEILLAMN